MLVDGYITAGDTANHTCNEVAKMSLSKITGPSALATFNSKAWLTKAMKYCPGARMDLKQFMEVIQHPICQTTFDMFYCHLKSNCPVYMSRSTIEWFGYGGPYGKQKQLVTRMLDHYEEGKDWVKMNKKEYMEWYSKPNRGYSREYPQDNESKQIHIDPSQYKLAGVDASVFKNDTTEVAYPDPSELPSRTTHIFVTVDTFKRIVMRSDSPKAEQIRTYYINMEDLMFKYMEYTAMMRTHATLSIMENLHLMRLQATEANEKADIANQKAEEERQQAKEARREANKERKKAEEERRRAEIRDKKANEKFEALMKRTERVSDTLDRTETKLDDTQDTLENTQETLEETKQIALDIANDRVVDTGLPSNLSYVFAVIKLDEPAEGERTYYAVRCQKKNFQYRVNQVINGRDNARVILRLDTPCSMKLWHMYKNKYSHHIKHDRQWFNMRGTRSENGMLTRICRIHESRMNMHGN